MNLFFLSFFSKLKYFISFVFFLLLFLQSCGMEDSTYFQDARNIYIDGNGSENVLVKFYGFNQAHDGGFYLFVGYDIYYYFDNPSNAKLAMVYYPIVIPSGTSGYTNFTGNGLLLQFPTDPDNSSRFPASNFSSSMTNFYQTVSFPVRYSAIGGILTEGSNNNVRFSFRVSDMSQSNFTNHVTNSSEHYVMLGGIYPNFSEYQTLPWGQGQYWYSGSTRRRFLGFYDKNYYTYRNGGTLASPSVQPISNDGSYSIYRVYFYIVPKGFNSITDRSQSYTPGPQSSVFEVRFMVNNNTRDYP